MCSYYHSDYESMTHAMSGRDMTRDWQSSNAGDQLRPFTIQPASEYSEHSVGNWHAVDSPPVCNRPVIIYTSLSNKHCSCTKT
jgi:hypothetical protein